MPQDHIQEHIDLIARHEQEFLSKRTPLERAGDRLAGLVGSLRFVGIHLALFLGWISWNLVARLPPFDPPPFSLLATFLAMEGIVLASVILMRQARMSRRADERDHLMLQVLLLAEKEITASLKMNRQIAHKVGLTDAAAGEEVSNLSQHISIEDVAQTIRETIPADE